MLYESHNESEEKLVLTWTIEKSVTYGFLSSRWNVMQNLSSSQWSVQWFWAGRVKSSPLAAALPGVYVVNLHAYGSAFEDKVTNPSTLSEKREGEKDNKATSGQTDLNKGQRECSLVAYVGKLQCLICNAFRKMHLHMLTDVTRINEKKSRTLKVFQQMLILRCVCFCCIFGFHQIDIKHK